MPRWKNAPRGKPAILRRIHQAQVNRNESESRRPAVAGGVILQDEVLVVGAPEDGILLLLRSRPEGDGELRAGLPGLRVLRWVRLDVTTGVVPPLALLLVRAKDRAAHLPGPTGEPVL